MLTNPDQENHACTPLTAPHIPRFSFTNFETKTSTFFLSTLGRAANEENYYCSITPSTPHSSPFFFSPLGLPLRLPPSSPPFVSLSARTKLCLTFSHEPILRSFLMNCSLNAFSRTALRLFSHDPFFDCFLTNRSSTVFSRTAPSALLTNRSSTFFSRTAP